MISAKRVMLASACATAFAATTVRAQHAAFETGNVLVGGSAGIHREHIKGPSGGDETTMFLNPQALYFVASRLAVGASATLNHSSSKSSSGSGLGIAPTIRFYFLNSASNFRPYATASVFVTRNEAKSKGILASENSQKYVSPDIAAGVTYMLSDDIGVLSEAYFSQRTARSKLNALPESKSETSEYGLRFGLNIFLR